MTTIPDDMVERVARAIADQMHAGGDFGMTGADAYRRRSAEFMSMARAAIEAMQPAILAERERCARVADAYSECERDCGDVIAADIRSQS